jgi:1,4-alpha-glucan branching enzyme
MTSTHELAGSKEESMLHKMPSPRAGHIRVVFELPACIWADRIFLVGDFNEWGVEATPFVQGRDGIWRAAVDLPAGRSYQFRYLVDGSWQTDYHADGWQDNGYGTQNSIVNAVLEDSEVVHIEQTSLLREELKENGRGHRRQKLVTPLRQPKTVTRYLNYSSERVAG